MIDRASVYRRSPYPIKVAMATIRGRQLDRLRYGSETESLVVEALEREGWGAGRWLEWQQDRLAELLERAARDVPYYRRRWRERRSRGDRSDVRKLSSWPVLTKAEIRMNARDLIAQAMDGRRLVAVHTSGTTGSPLTVWHSKDGQRRWYAVFEARVRRWNTVTRADPWGLLGGQLVVTAARTRPPFWVWNAAGRQLYLSSFHLSERSAPHYARALERAKVAYLVGYPSALYELARGMKNAGLTTPLRVVITNAEPLSEHQRETIAKAFSCPVRDTYGTAEQVAAASECREGSMHLWPESGVVEVLRDDAGENARPGEVGRLVCTGLMNRSMPLIRYEVGDRGAVTSSSCPCGRDLPVLEQIEGRVDDVVVTPDGRRVGRLDSVFKGGIKVKEAQVIQESARAIRVLVVPDGPKLTSSTRDELAQRLTDRLGEIEISIEETTAIPRTATGKFRGIVSHL